MGVVVALILALILPAPQISVLRIRVTVADADGRARPVPRHALLISDNPVTAAPQRVVTNIDGVADIRLKPGNYTIESDEPLITDSKTYQWVQTIDVATGRDTTLDLNAANAMVETAAPGAAAPTPAMNTASAASAILSDWQHSVFTLWSPKRIGAGFLVDARGLIATSARFVGKATDLELQISPERKVPARVLAADAKADVAVLWADPKALGPAKPVRLAMPAEGKPAIAAGDEVFAIETSPNDRKSLASGIVTRLSTHTISTNVNLARDNTGVPLFNAGGEVVALTTVSEDANDGMDVSPRAVRIQDAVAVLAEAEQKIRNAQPPSGTLPIEPTRPLSAEKLRDAARARAGSLSAYMIPASDFDVALLTPLLVYGAHHRGDRERAPTMRDPGQLQPALRALEDFGDWSDYVSDNPPVLLVRVTPKLVEGFWTTVGRAAASTQGMSIPPIKRIKAGFAKLRAFCGDVEVLPIHPFRIEHRVDEKNTIDEGLYVFDPDALGPRCSSVKLMLYSEKEPDKPDTRTIDPKVIEQIQDDFARVR